jgi:hypothetical protein
MVDVGEILKKVSKRGMSRDCQDRLPRLAEAYFQGADLSRMRAMYRNKKGCANQVYSCLDPYARPPHLLKTISEYLGPRVGKIPRDFIKKGGETELVDSIMEVFSKEDKDISELINLLEGEDRRLLEKRFIENERNSGARSAMILLARNPEFYQKVFGNLS